MADHVRLPSVQPLLERAARVAHFDPYGARQFLLGAARGEAGPPLSEVIVVGWVFAPDFDQTLLVRHPRLGWLSPGGRLEVGESPAAGAAREVVEETGLEVRLAVDVPVAILSNTAPPERLYGLAYAFIADRATPLQPEPEQAAAWFGLRQMPESFFPYDGDCLRLTASDLTAGRLTRV